MTKGKQIKSKNHVNRVFQMQQRCQVGTTCSLDLTVRPGEARLGWVEEWMRVWKWKSWLGSSQSGLALEIPPPKSPKKQKPKTQHLSIIGVTPLFRAHFCLKMYLQDCHLERWLCNTERLVPLIEVQYKSFIPTFLRGWGMPLHTGPHEEAPGLVRSLKKWVSRKHGPESLLCFPPC